jgi:nucleoside 2-deoxyribosyltransferase
MKTVYLAGKITLDNENTEYRSLVAPIFRDHSFHCLDPIRGKYDPGDWDSLPTNEIVARDLEDIRRANVVLAVITKGGRASFGTVSEIMFAYTLGKPIIFVTNDESMVKHPWVETLVSKLFFFNVSAEVALKDAVAHICHWYGEELEQEVYTSPVMVQPVVRPKCDPLDDA